MNIFNYATVNMCRLCENTKELQKIFNDDMRHILKKLRACADITVEKDDSLPKSVCASCIKNIEYAYKFKIQCEYTDQKLRDAIERALQESEEPKENTLDDFKTDSLDQYEIEYDGENIIQYEYVVNEDEVLENDGGGGDDDEAVCEEDVKEEVTEDGQQQYDQIIHHIFDENVIEENDSSSKNDVNEMYIMTEDGVEETETEMFPEEEDNDEKNEHEIEKSYDDQTVDEYVECDGEIMKQEYTLSENDVDGESGQLENDGELYFINDEDGNLEESEMTIVQESHPDGVVEAGDEKKGEFECWACSASFESAEKLENHKRIHTNKRFCCEQCPRSFSKRYHLKNHEVLHSGEKRFKCDECEKVYTNHGNLDRHIRVYHNNERRHFCDQCGKGFSQLSTLRNHYSVHIEDRLYECDICQKRYKTPEHLSLHKDRHKPRELRKTRTYVPTKKPKPPIKKICVCSYCGKKSNTIGLHQSHLRTHTGEKPYECPTCHKRFAFQQSLKSHVLLHTGEKPFKCNECHLSFRQIGHLKGHQLVHTGEKHHVCQICHKSFALRGNLTVHMRIHTGSTPYHCDLCPKKFYDSNGLKRHRVVHARQKSGNPAQFTGILEPDIGQGIIITTDSQLHYDEVNNSYSILNISAANELDIIKPGI